MRIGLDDFFVELDKQINEFRFNTLEKSKSEIYHLNEKINFYEDIFDYLTQFAFTDLNVDYYGNRYKNLAKTSEFADDLLNKLWIFYKNNYLFDVDTQAKDFNRLLNSYALYYEENQEAVSE